jgi:AmmeMemoRadiSam system protein A
VRPRGPALVQFARARVRQELGGPLAIVPGDPWASELCATFVTLRWRDGELQGCIGNLDADRAIVLDVASNAVAAATRDPRGARFELADVDDLAVELSILSALEPVAEVAIRIGDGVVVEYRGRRATFLPVMWEQLPDRATFLRELDRKAGLPREVDRDELVFSRYTAEHFVDPAS